MVAASNLANAVRGATVTGSRITYRSLVPPGFGHNLSTNPVFIHSPLASGPLDDLIGRSDEVSVNSWRLVVRA
jgi:hypothetical protein